MDDTEYVQTLKLKGPASLKRVLTLSAVAKEVSFDLDTHAINLLGRLTAFRSDKR